MEASVSPERENNSKDSVVDEEEENQSESSPHPAAEPPQDSTGAAGSPAVTLVQLSDGQTVQVHGVIQAPQTSVIQSPQVQTAQVATVAELEDGEAFRDTQKRREILSRRPSYRKILNELSSDPPAVPKIDEEEKTGTEVMMVSTGASVPTPTPIYQTSSGQYIAFTQGRAIQLTSPGPADALQGAQTLTVASSPAAADSPQQLYIQGGQVLIQAATGDIPAYQLRSPNSGLAQGIVMSASPGAMQSPQPHAEEITRKREVRLMKNREAARECRRKKKEYVKCLENRVAVLENQNKTLIEELKALKDIYCHKAE